MTRSDFDDSYKDKNPSPICQICLPSDRRPERSSMRQHKSSTTINSSGNDQRLDQESFQRRWSFRLPHSSISSSSSSWTALKIPDYFKESSKTEVEKDRAKVAESPVSSPVSLKRFVSHSDLTQVSNKPRYGSLSTFPSTHSSSTSSIPAKVNLILISGIS